MENNIIIPLSYFIAMIALLIHLLGSCLYLFWKWHKTIESADRWEKKTKGMEKYIDSLTS
jgi:succinate dehydrogenase/fumarate reductase cytochrome b subunit